MAWPVQQGTVLEAGSALVCPTKQCRYPTPMLQMCPTVHVQQPTTQAENAGLGPIVLQAQTILFHVMVATTAANGA